MILDYAKAEEWLIALGVHVLNVAGNSDDTAPGIGDWAECYLIATLLATLDYYRRHGKC